MRFGKYNHWQIYGERQSFCSILNFDVFCAQKMDLSLKSTYFIYII
jgi:hypothetical protein